MKNNSDLDEAIRQLKDAEKLRSEAFKVKPIKLICKPKDFGLFIRVLNAND
jgi:hypothetical protein